MAAGRQTLSELARALLARDSFVYETTLSSSQSVELMRAAKIAEYEVGLVFVALNSAALNVQRVADRVARGGHHIPQDIIRRRYEASIRRLPHAIRLADASMLFDNSAASGPHLLMELRATTIGVNNLDAAKALHCRLAEAVGAALSMSKDAIFRAGKPG